MRNHKQTPESLISSESTELKQVDVTGVGPKSEELRNQSRTEDTKEMIDSITSTSNMKSALFGFKKSDVQDQFLLTRDKMFEMSDLIKVQNIKIKELEELKESIEQTHREQQELAAPVDTESIDSQLEDLRGELTASQAEVERLTAENKSLQEALKELKEADTASEISSEEFYDMKSRLDAAESELESKGAQIEYLDSEVKRVTKQADEYKAEIASQAEKIRELEMKLAEKEAAYEALERSLDNSGEAYKNIGRVLADANRRADEIVAEANEKAAAIREDAENDHKERIERTNEDVENILTKASDTITDMFEESAKARKQIVASHNTLMNSARANQDKLLAIMVEQKDLFKGQVEIATSNELEDIFTKSQFRLTSAENFLESRHREYSETLKNLKNNASR